MRTEKYLEQKKRLPEKGKQIIGSIEGNAIIVYQAFNPQIAEFALKNQHFGGSAYSYSRMSWIKPGFLWMMYRSGWASKPNQVVILAITLPTIHFMHILSQATISSFSMGHFESVDNWKDELSKTEVRLQWDPDHDPFGSKQERKAIQLGMKGEVLRRFCTQWITEIKDITPFAKEELGKVQRNNINDLNVPYEEILKIEDIDIALRIGIDK